MKKTEDMSAAAEGCIVMLSGLVLIPVGLASWGWAYQCLWNWFVAPAFSLPQFGFAMSCGLMLFVSILKSRTLSRPDQSPSEIIAGSVVYNTLSPALLLLCGLVVRQFI